jgi:hypothetical protein
MQPELNLGDSDADSPESFKVTEKKTGDVSTDSRPLDY